MSYTNGLDKPTDYFNTTLYSGNDGTQSITSLDFQPDFLWFKSRNTVVSNTLVDSIRGNTKQLSSDSTGAETTPTYPYVDTFNSDGWTMTNGSLSGGNTSGRTYANWGWKAGGTASSNTDGSITSSVSANQDAGFSIVSYTGSGANATIGHGLGVAPKMIIIRRRTGSTTNWIVYHESIGNDNELYLNTTDASTSSTRFQSTSPTSSVFSVSSNSAVNESSQSIIAYCFAEKKGFSKFGSYTGNGSNEGPFIYTGFKPAFVIFKRTNSTGNWALLDNKRIGYNGSNYWLEPNTSDAEDSESSWLDLLSNGFKFTVGGTLGNASGSSYIYMAFAENPFVTSTGIPTTAR
jgi:hypothetical protein